MSSELEVFTFEQTDPPGLYRVFACSNNELEFTSGSWVTKVNYKIIFEQVEESISAWRRKTALLKKSSSGCTQTLVLWRASPQGIFEFMKEFKRRNKHEAAVKFTCAENVELEKCARKGKE